MGLVSHHSSPFLLSSRLPGPQKSDLSSQILLTHTPREDGAQSCTDHTGSLNLHKLVVLSFRGGESRGVISGGNQLISRAPSTFIWPSSTEEDWSADGSEEKKSIVQIRLLNKLWTYCPISRRACWSRELFFFCFSETLYLWHWCTTLRTKCQREVNHTVQRKQTEAQGVFYWLALARTSCLALVDSSSECRHLDLRVAPRSPRLNKHFLWRRWDVFHRVIFLCYRTWTTINHSLKGLMCRSISWPEAVESAGWRICTDLDGDGLAALWSAKLTGCWLWAYIYWTDI